MIRRSPRNLLLGLGLAAAFLTGSQTAQGATPLLPGSPLIDSAKIQPFRATTSWGTMEVSQGKLQGRPALNIVNQVRLPSGELLVDHIVLDGPSMGLIFRFAPYFAVGQDYLVAALQGSRLRGSLNPLTGEEALPLATDLASPVFEESVLGLVLATLPLEENFETQMPRLGIRASDKGFFAGMIDIRVKGREEIRGGDKKKYDCWVVEADRKALNFQETLWIADQPPYLIQKISVFPDGRQQKSGFESVSVEK